ncbi:MAG: SdrD B-like domain-containing protein, partial [Chloroflexota bacterium]
MGRTYIRTAMLLFFITLMIYTQAVEVYAAGQISGIVFRDFNANATQDANEPPIEGVQVVGTDELGNVVNATTDATGTYTLPFLAGDSARVEFVLPASLDFLQPGAGSLAGGNSGFSSVQFIDISGGNVTGVDVGFNNPSQYCHANPELVVSCYVYGEVDEPPFTTDGGTTIFNPAVQTALLSFPYDTSGTTVSSGTYDRQAFNADIGAVWGTSYHARSDSLLVSAFTKRHSGFGPGGPGAIYNIDFSRAGSGPGAAGAVSLWVDLAAVTGNTFTDSHSPLPDPGRTQGNLFDDIDAFNGVGTTSLGDLDLNADESVVYVSDLENRGGSNRPLLYELSMNPDGSYGGTVNQIEYPAAVTGVNGVVQGCANGDLRAGALKYNNGRLFAGLTCAPLYAYDANDPDNPPDDQLRAYVFAYDPGVGWQANPVAEFDLNYPRGDASTDPPNTLVGDWSSWTLSTDGVIDGDDFRPEMPFGKQQGRAQPLLSDIEFDERGFMIVGLMDRNGHQTGNAEGAAGAGPVEGISAGDTLRLIPDNQTLPTGWTLENAGSDGTSTGSATNSEGPGGGEFYFEDAFGTTHDEVTLGGLALLYGSNEVVASVFDPLAIRSGGVRTLSNTGGTAVRNAEVFVQDAPGTFGKAAGIGDVEMVCGLAPIEVGNRIWLDVDNDGIQDPGEAGIPGVTLQLFIDSDGDGTPDLLVGTTTTDGAGEYLFNGTNITLNTGPNITFVDTNGNGIRETIEPTGIMPGTTYEIRVDETQTTLTPYTLSANDQDGDATNNNKTDTIDSDAVTVGTDSVITFTSGLPGENNHTLDIGYVPAYDLALIKTLATGQPSTVTAGDDVLFTITVTNQGGVTSGNFTVSDILPADFTYSGTNSTPTGTLTSTPSSATVNITNNGDGTFDFDDLPAGDSVSFDIELTLDAGFVGSSVENRAEISTDSGDDVDSTPDATTDNGNGENDVDEVDDSITDPNDEDDHDLAIITVDQYDLALIKQLATGQPSTVTAGDDVLFTITVTNQGGVDSGNFTVSDILPADLTYSGTNSTPTGTLTSTPSSTTVNITNNGDGTFDFDDLPAGDSVSFDIELTLDAGFTGTSITNRAEISTDSGDEEDSTPDGSTDNGNGENDVDEVDDSITDPNDEDDHDLALVNVSQYDLALIKQLATGQPATVSAGDDVLFTITVTNQGNVDSGVFVVSDILPADFTYSNTNSTSSGILTSTNSNTVNITNNGDGTFDFDNLVSGDSVSFDIELTLSGTFTGTSIENRAEISTDSGDDVDSTPDDTTDNGNGENDVDEVDDSITDPNDEDDHDLALITVTQNTDYDLALRKTLATGQPAVITPGDNVTFTITIFNQGLLPSDTFTVEDYIPADTTFSSATASGNLTSTNGATVTYVNNGDGTFALDGLPAGDDVSFDITLTVSPTFTGTVAINAAEITTDSGDDTDSTPDDTDGNTPGETTDEIEDDDVNGGSTSGDPTIPDEDDHDITEISITQPFDLALRKLTTSGTVNPGEDVTFSITVFNQGSSTAFDVDVVDYVPAGLTFDEAANTAAATGNPNDWTLVGGLPTYTIDSIAGGDSATITIILSVESTFTGTDAINAAEVSDGSDTDGGTTTADADSTPDTDDSNDGPTEDNNITSTNGDEDDFDISTVNIDQPIFDWGDLPDGYATDNTDDSGEGIGAAHRIIDNLRFGTEIDEEDSGVPSTGADGDDTETTPDDEDGVNIPTLTAGATITIPVEVFNNTGGDAFVNGWIDWNGDGDFDDPDEQVATNITIPSGSGIQTANVTVTVPAGATTGTTYSRWRLSTTSGNTSTGIDNSGGEVEDYAVTVDGPGVSLIKSDSAAAIVAGQPTTYTITVQNTDVNDVDDEVIVDNLPVTAPNGFDPATVSWTCTATGGASCDGTSATPVDSRTSADSTNNPWELNETVDLPAGSQIVYLLTGTLYAEATDAQITNTVTSNPSGKTAIDVNGVIYDPPTGTKVGAFQDQTTIRWTQVWINSASTLQTNVRIVDPIGNNQSYVNGSIACSTDTAGGSVTVTTLCDFDTTTNSVVFEGTIGPDGPGTAPADGQPDDSLIITFEVTVTGTGGFQNTSTLTVTGGPGIGTATSAGATVGGGSNDD